MDSVVISYQEHVPILLRNLRLALDQPEDELLSAAAKRLGVTVEAIRAYAPVRRSLDARDHEDVHFVYHVELALHGGMKEERQRVQRLKQGTAQIIDTRAVSDHRSKTGAILSLRIPQSAFRNFRGRPIVVGFGPAGMFAALHLAEAGCCPIVLERGREVRRRHKDILQTFYRQGQFNDESNLLYGEGGAGAYSDGKLYTRLSEPLVTDVLQAFYRFGADPDILLDARPHIGSDKLPTICVHLREHIERLGGEIRFEHRLDDLEINDGKLTALIVNGQRMEAGPVLLAIGHSARDTVRMLVRRGVTVAAKPFQLGVRIEHPQARVDRWQYRGFCGHERLPPADYHLVAKSAAGPGDLFSFCMCPGGVILPSMESAGLIATNGASRSSRNGPFANSGLVVTVDPEFVGHDPLQGLAFQEELERRAFEMSGGTYRVPCQRADDYLHARSSDGSIDTSYPLGGQWCDLRSLLPESVHAALERGLRILDRKLPGYAGKEALITAPETRASAPIRILRDPATRQSVSTRNLYPIGEGAGYAGGIVSAAVDGLKTAQGLLENNA